MAFKGLIKNLPLLQVNNHLTVLETVTLKEFSFPKHMEKENNAGEIQVKQELMSCEEEFVNPEEMCETTEPSDFNEDENRASFTIITDVSLATFCLCFCDLPQSNVISNMVYNLDILC